MNTIRATITDRLQEHGLWPQEAEAVMSAVEAAPENESMKGRWGETPDAYPPMIMTLAWLSAKTKAVEWIDENKPQHFARGMFL